MATLTKGKTFTSGETVTPTKLHELVDLGTVTNIVDADISASAAIAASKLAGTLDLSSKTITLPDASVAQAKLAANVAGNGPTFRAHSSVTTSLPNNTTTKIVLNTEAFDTNSNFNTTTSAFTPTVAGYYLIVGSVHVSAGADLLNPRIYKNGSQHSGGQAVSATTFAAQVTDLIYLNGTTDYVELYAYHNAGGTRTATADSERTYFSGFLARTA